MLVKDHLTSPTPQKKKKEKKIKLKVTPDRMCPELSFKAEGLGQRVLNNL
jgi:hypothetical protein